MLWVQARGCGEIALCEQLQLEWGWLVATAVASCCDDTVSACGLVDVLCLKEGCYEGGR